MLRIINQILVKVNSKDGFTHWAVQRLTALSVIFGISATFITNNLYFFIILLSFLIFHILIGIRTLIDDYIHDNILFLVANTFLRLISIFTFKTILILFIC